MVNYHGPVIVMKDDLVLSKIWHAVAGLYFWEFVTTLDYEWSVIRGHRPFRWTIWIYSTTRISTLIALILILVCLDVTAARYNCEVGSAFQLLFAYLAVASASLLILLRIFAIWKNNKVIIAIAAGAWVISVIFQIQCIVRIRAAWVSEACVITNLHIANLNVLITLTTDTTLLLIMFFGLRRRGFHDREAFGLGRFMWKQGVIWLLVATIADVLPAVFLCLNINGLFDNMFLPPSVITLSIAATRIHRSLLDYVSSDTKQQSRLESSKRRGRMGCIENKVPIILSGMKMTINKTSDEDQMRQTSQDGSPACTEGQACKTPGKQDRLDEDVEYDVESQTQISI